MPRSKIYEKSYTELDWDSVDFDGDWTWDMFGHPLGNGEWAIIHTDKALNETRYKMPDCISRMLQLQYQYGVTDKLRKIKAALEI